jgi:tetratricopeptide (TPR) repeat protein
VTGDRATATSGPFQLGRFTVLADVGRGGMGTVFVAYDPDLDRKIALKVLHTRGERARGEVLQEGRALARLRHPNVVAVYEVGVVDEDVFVAMEHVEGSDLRAWLRTPRDAATTLTRMIEAGRGLAAAHAAGLVHRDFKPENLMIDADGRARVVDFGLARAADELWATSSALDGTSRSRSAGSPGYTAPERLAGLPGDHRADQFTFCVTCWEALFGERPADEHGRVPAGRVPARVVRALRRGLAAAPERRFVGMSALLAALGERPRRRWLGLVVAGAAALMVAGFALGRRSQEALPVCQAPAELLASTWSPARAGALRAAFVASGAPSGSSTWASTSAALDRFVDAWQAAYVRACEETRVLAVATPAQYEQRTLCLEERRLHLAALLDRFAEADRTTVARALAAVDRLPTVEGCEGAEVQAEPTEPTELPAHVEERLALRAEIAGVRADLSTGRTAGLDERLAGAAERVRGHGEPRMLAEVLVSAATHERNAGRRSEALEHTREALGLAVESGESVLAVDAVVLRIQLHRDLAPGGPLQDDLLGLAAAFCEQAGDPPELRGTVMYAHATELMEVGRNAEAQALLEQALGLAEARGSVTAVGQVLQALAKCRQRLGDYAGAVATARRAIAELEAAFGPMHRQLAALHNDLANDLLALGESATALEHIGRSTQIVLANYGPDHSTLAANQGNLAKVMLDLGRLEDAVVAFRESRATFGRALGPKHPTAAMMDCATAMVLRKLGRQEEALTEVTAGMAIYGEQVPPGDCSLLACTAIRGQVLHRLGRDREAVLLVEPALALARAGTCVPEQRGDLELALAEALYGLHGAREARRIRELLTQSSPLVDAEAAAEVERLRAALDR